MRLEAWLAHASCLVTYPRLHPSRPLPCRSFLFSFVIGQCFLSMMCSMQWGVFLFFAGWVAIMTLFVQFCLPGETGR